MPNYKYNFPSAVKKKKSLSRLELLKEKRAKNRLRISSSRIDKKRLKSKLAKVGMVVFAFFLVSGIIGGIFFLIYIQGLNSQLPTPEKVFPDRPVASEIYDRLALESPSEGSRLYRLFNEYNSDPVDISQVPEIVKWAFLAAEDIDFYNHPGFDFTAIIRCAFNYIRSPGSICGGSTVTQQLTKITALGNEVALERKIKELLLALKVEQAYDKDQILEMYLRVAPFGSSIYGVKTAANFYFGKEPKDLSLAEASILSAIIQNPVYLSPTLAPDTDVSKVRVKERQLYVLGQLERNIQKINDQIRINLNDPDLPDMLTMEMIEEAKVEELSYRPPIATDKKAGHFVNYVIDQLTSRNYKNNEEPFTLAELQNGGYKIYTTLDYGLQQRAEFYTAKGGNDYQYWNQYNAAIMTTIPSTGQIVTMVGSKSFTGEKEQCDASGNLCKFDPQVNILTSLQSPGSTNKPLGYYLAFKEGKLFTGSLLPDIPVNLRDGAGNLYSPKNWDGGFWGPRISARTALYESRNIPAVIVAEMVGVSNYINTAKEWGYTTYTGSYGQAIILGGADVLPVEHAQAYGVFANGGDFVRLNPILKILDKDGKTIYEATPEKKSIGDPQAIWLLNQAQFNKDGFSWDGREIAGKTGTSEDNKDSWFIVYSPDFVTLAWSGNNNNDPINQQFGWSINVIQPWLKEYMREIGQSKYFSAKSSFQRPGFVYQGGGNCNDKGECLGIEPGWLIQDRTPPFDNKLVKSTVCKEQKDKLARPIDIAIGMAEEAEFIYYVMPVQSLQEQLNTYMSTKVGYVNGAPTEFCNIDRTGGVTGPFFPSFSGTISGININIKGSVFTTVEGGSISSLSFSLSSQSIPSCTTTSYSSFDITCNISSLNLNSGEIELKATAKDTSNYTNTKSINVNLSSGISFNSLPPSALQYGVNVGPACSSGTCQYSIGISYSGEWTLSNIQAWQIRNNGSPTLIQNLGNPNTTFNWGGAILPPAGTDSYIFYITAKTQTGGNFRSSNSSVINVSF